MLSLRIAGLPAPIRRVLSKPGASLIRGEWGEGERESLTGLEAAKSEWSSLLI